MLRLLLAIFLFANTRTDRTAFSPNTKDYDAYGIKTAGNEIMLVESQGDQTAFLVCSVQLYIQFITMYN